MDLFASMIQKGLYSNKNPNHNVVKMHNLYMIVRASKPQFVREACSKRRKEKRSSVVSCHS